MENLTTTTASNTGVTISSLDMYPEYINKEGNNEHHYPYDDPRNTHITIGVIVAVVVLVAILVVVWCFKPCVARDKRMKTASNATSIASI